MSAFCTLKKVNAGFVKSILYNILCIFCLIFLIDAIKPNVEKKFNTFGYSTLYGKKVGRVQNKTIFVSFCVWFVSGNKNIIQKKQEYLFIIVNYRKIMIVSYLW